MAFGNGGEAGPRNTLYFTAGLTSHLTPHGGPFHGLFGSLTIAPAAAPASATTTVNRSVPVSASNNSEPVSSSPSNGTLSATGLPYPTAATVNQLVADINYANRTGGAITINLAPGKTFDLKTADNTTDGGNGLPVIGITRAVDLTINGNGDTIERVARSTGRPGNSNPFRLFDVAAASSLTLGRVMLRGGSGSVAGAIYNRGTLKVLDGKHPLR
jgi:hypothetical protein